MEGRMRTTTIIAFALALPSLANAATVPSLDLRELTDDADVIIVGTVLAVDVSREATVVLERGVAVRAKAMTPSAMTSSGSLSRSAHWTPRSTRTSTIGISPHE